MSKPRRRHTAEQKAELLRQHVAEKKPVSEVCNEAAIQPSLFYTWQRVEADPNCFTLHSRVPRRVHAAVRRRPHRPFGSRRPAPALRHRPQLGREHQHRHQPSRSVYL